ncbi:MAG: chitobiase/beta-hexosaminidase C-terminal domain-containing protein [Lachnospira sp.]
MPDDFKKDTSIEDEIEKSLKRMVEEETTVAKAFVGKSSDYKGNAVSEDNDTDYGKTRVIPDIPEELLSNDKNVSGGMSEDDLSDDEDFDVLFDDDEEDDDIDIVSRSDNTRRTGNVQKTADSKTAGGTNRMDKKTKLIFAGIAAGVVIVIIVIVLIAVSLNKKSKQNYDYYYNEGMKLYEQGNYGDASNYLGKASKESEGKKNLNLRYVLYQCYMKSGNEDAAVNELKDILSYDEDFEDAVKALADIYYKRGDAENLTKLIRKYENGKCANAVKDYIVSDPVPSKEAGSYDDNIELKFTCGSGDVIYYTTDGSEPTKKSSLYDGSAIKIESGTTQIKAVAYNSTGVSSNIVELKYVIEYGAPAAPEVTPASGKYSSGEKVKINNIPDKCKAYYTLDGTTPTASSTEYTGEFDMPVGNTVISFIIINDHDQCSTVVKRNYDVTAKNTYTYSQAESQLKTTLIAKKVLVSESQAADGSKVNFVYQTRTTVDGVEMYVIRYDVIKNGTTSTAGFYGVDISTGKVYKVTGSEGNYSAKAY